MFRILFFLLLVLGIGFLFAWVADNPGTIFVKWDWLSMQMTGETGNEFGIPLTLAIAVMILLIAAVMLVTGLLRGIFGMPVFLSRFFENRRRDRGYKALSRGLIAASSGDLDMARTASKESGKLLGEEPLVALLATQTALLEGKRDDARRNFQKMLENEDTKLVALRGLFLEAERQGEPAAAKHYAEEAVRLAPSLPWAGNAKLSYQAGDGDWDAAIITLDANRAAGLIEREKAKRQRAVLLTAKAMDQEAADPENARSLAKQAHKLAPDLVPAAVTCSSAASRLGDIKGASRVIETTWKKLPHPELAQAYSVVRPGDSVQDRLKRARKLAGLNPNHPESCMALAIAAIDAQEWQEARDALKPVLTTRPSERACLLMADIEEGEHGDQGRMRDWLSRAVRAQPDPKWVADGHVSEEWMPVSPITGEVDAFEWKVPVENIGKLEVPVISSEELQELAKPVQDIPAPASPAIEPEPDNDAELTIEGTTSSKHSVVSPAAAAIAEKALQNETDADHEEESQNVTGATGETQKEEPDPDTRPKEATATETSPANTSTTTASPEMADPANSNNAPNTKTGQGEPATVAEHSKNKKPEDQVDESDEFPLKRRPDDPGVHPDKIADGKKKGFGLF
jgi:HemY protein